MSDDYSYFYLETTICNLTRRKTTKINKLKHSLKCGKGKILSTLIPVDIDRIQLDKTKLAY